MRTPLLAVASLAVDVLVRAITSDDRVQGLVAVFALEALAMPLATLGQNLLGSEHYTTAAGATLARGSLDLGSVDDSGLGGVVLSVRVTIT